MSAAQLAAAAPAAPPAATSSTMSPAPERMVRISKMVSCRPSARIASALSENDSSAPVIHATRPSSMAAMLGDGVEAARREAMRRSFGVGLVFRPRLVEGRQLQAGRVGRDELRKCVMRTLSRRALYTCGTRQMSASVTLPPKQ